MSLLDSAFYKNAPDEEVELPPLKPGECPACEFNRAYPAHRITTRKSVCSVRHRSAWIIMTYPRIPSQPFKPPTSDATPMDWFAIVKAFPRETLSKYSLPIMCVLQRHPEYNDGEVPHPRSNRIRTRRTTAISMLVLRKRYRTATVICSPRSGSCLC